MGVIHLQNYVNLTLPQEIHLILKGTTWMGFDRVRFPRRHEGYEITGFHVVLVQKLIRVGYHEEQHRSLLRKLQPMLQVHLVLKVHQKS